MTPSTAESPAVGKPIDANASEAKKDDKAEKRRALGRGLESLLPGPRAVVPSITRGALPNPAENQRASTVESLHAVSAQAQVAVANQGKIASISAETSAGEVVLPLALDVIDKNPYQTRSLFREQEMLELSESIREHGVVQPIVVRPAQETGRYILVLGERRLRASKMAGKESIPALVRRLSPQQAAEMTVLENVAREDLNPIEQAEAYRVLSQEFSLTQVQIAQRIGVSRESVANHMRLLRLPEEVKKHVAEGRIGFSQARELLALETGEQIEAVAREILTQDLTWADLRRRVESLSGNLNPPSPAPQQARWVDPNVLAAQEEMQRLLGVRVKIKDRKGHGLILIEYGSVDDYERIVDIVRSGSNS